MNLKRFSFLTKTTKALLVVSAVLWGSCLFYSSCLVLAGLNRGRAWVFAWASVFSVAAVLPHIVAFVLYRLNKTHLASGITAGIAIQLCLVNIGVVLALFSGLGLIVAGEAGGDYTGHGHPERGFVILAAVLLPPLFLHVLMFVSTLLAGQGKKPFSQIAAALLTIAFSIGIGSGAVLIVWNLKPIPPNDESVRSTTDAVYSCLFRYASKHPDSGFPPNLTPLQTEGCVDRELLAGEKFEYKFVYAPGAPDSRGKISEFRFRSFPANMEADRNAVSYFGDESGLLVYRPNQHGSERYFSPLHPVPRYAGALVDCLARYHEDDPAGSFPQDLDTLFRSRPYCKAVSGTQVVGLSGNTIHLQEAPVSYQCIYSAKFDRPKKKVTGYSIAVVPDQYAMPQVRSYYVDESLITRATAENRLPNSSDKEANRCEKVVVLGDPGECDMEWVLQWVDIPH